MTARLRIVLWSGLLFGLVGVGCTQSVPEGEGWGPSIADLSAERIREAIGSLNGIPSHAEGRLDQAQEELEENGDIAHFLVNGPLEDDAEAKLAGYRAFSRAIVDLHLQRHLDETLTDERMEQYYSEHPDEFGETRFHIAHVFVRADPDADSTVVERAREKIRKLHAQLEQGAEFEEVVRAGSEDAATREDGGDLGWLNADLANPELVAAARALKAGDISEPVRTTRGFHVIRLVEAPSVEPQPFAQVERQVRYRLREQLRVQELERIREEARSKEKASSEASS